MQGCKRPFWVEAALWRDGRGRKGSPGLELWEGEVVEGGVKAQTPKSWMWHETGKGGLDMLVFAVASPWLGQEGPLARGDVGNAN